MQNIVITKPYVFVPPLNSWFWNRTFGVVLPYYLQWKYGIAKREYRGVERLRASVAAGHGIVPAANHRAKQTPPGKVVIHPVAMHYYFDGDIEAAAAAVLHPIETRLSWRTQDVPLLPRIAKLLDALLAMKEVEYLGRAQTGSFAE